MDKATLTKEQLKELKKFIMSRGFREPLIVMEILDHFACLVEERMAADRNLPLADAMQQAHSSFGVMGFRTIADAADMERSKRHYKLLLKHFRLLLLNPFLLIILTLSGILYYRLYCWVQPFHFGILSGAYIMDFTYLLIYGTGICLMYKQLPETYRRYVSRSGGFRDNIFSWITFIMFICYPEYSGGDDPLWAFGLVASVFTVFLVFYVIAEYNALKALNNHYRHTEAMFAELDS